MEGHRNGRRSGSLLLGIAVAAGLAPGVVPRGFAPALAHVKDPPLEHTGGFDEESCHRCHFDNPVNDPSGRMEIEGVPDVYRPGASYSIRIALSHPDMDRGGFEMAARFTGGEHEGEQAGVLESPDDDTTIVAAPSGTLYAHHTKRGATPSETSISRWLVEWQAPDVPNADVVFHIAANAANYDDSELGDYIYVDALRSQAPLE